MRKSVVVLALFVGIAGPALAKDLVIVERVSGRPAATAPYERTEYLTPTLRAVDGPYSRTVVDAKTRTVTVIDKEDRTYWQVSFDSLRRETDALAANTHAKDPRFKLPVTLKATGTTETIAGHPAAEYALGGGYPDGSVWLAKDIETPADPALWKDWSGLGARLGMDGKVADVVAGMKGVPLRTVTTTTGIPAKVTVTAEATAVREGAPPADLTAIPDGYTRANRHSQSH
jgi:hypothetical protein